MDLKENTQILLKNTIETTRKKLRELKEQIDHLYEFQTTDPLLKLNNEKTLTKLLEDEKFEQGKLKDYTCDLEASEYTHDKQLFDYFKELQIQYNRDILRNYKYRIETFLIHSNLFFKYGLSWLWYHLLLDESEFIPIRAEDINDINAALAGLKEEDEGFDEILNVESEIEQVASVIVNQLYIKNKVYVIENAVELFHKENTLKFFSEIWKPICEKIDKKNPPHKVLLLLIANGTNISEFKNIYTHDPTDSYKNKKPLLIESYNGFINKMQINTDVQNFQDWVIKDKNRGKKGVFSEPTKDGLPFYDKFKIKSDYEKYLQANCDCGTIEKLFHEICNDYEYKFKRMKQKAAWHIARK